MNNNIYDLFVVIVKSETNGQYEYLGHYNFDLYSQGKTYTKINQALTKLTGNTKQSEVAIDAIIYDLIEKQTQVTDFHIDNFHFIFTRVERVRGDDSF